MNDQIKKEKKRDIIALSIVGVIMLFVGFFSIKGFLEAPRDLGTDLAYVGKQDYGNIFGFDQLPGSTYYFATDMSESELITYINKSDQQYTGDGLGGASADYVYKGLSFGPDSSAADPHENSFSIDYFDEKNTQIALPIKGLKQTGKKHLVAIDAEYYPKLRQALIQAHLLK